MYKEPHPELLQKGIESNLRKQIENILKFQVPTVVCVNKRSTDTDEELQMVVDMASKYGAKAVISNHWEKGGQGAIDLAKTVVAESQKPQNFKLVYNHSQK